MWHVIVMATLVYFAPGNVKAAEEESPPHIVGFIQQDLVNPDDVTSKEGLKLPCNATGDNLKWKWKFNDNFIDPTQITSSGTLIKKSIDGASGTYQCFVENNKGATFSRKLKVKVPELPSFIRGSDQMLTVTVGEPTTLECPPRDKKGFNVAYQWRKSVLDTDRKVTFPQNDRRAITPEGNMHIMYVTSEDVKTIRDVGGMQCRMLAAGRYKDSKNINLKEGTAQAPTRDIPTSFYLPLPSKESAVAGQKKTLNCIATGRPAPVITWKKDGIEIIPDNDFKLLNNKRTLILNTKKATHEGTYTCEAKATGANKIQTQTVLTVKVPPYWSPTHPPKKITIDALQSGTITCPAAGDPAPSFTWYKNGTLLTPNDHIKIDGNKLHFNNVQMSDDHVYQCAVENEVGMIVGSTWVFIKAKEPTFAQLGPFYLFRNSTSALKCDPEAVPEPTAVWERKGREIKTAGRYQLHDDGRTLEIKNVVDDDKGEYKCTATNDYGSDSATGIAYILDRTEIIVAPRDVYIIERKPFDLRCEAKADKSLVLGYKWFKDGAELTFNSRLLWNEKTNILKVLNAQTDDTGKYTCLAYTSDPKRSEDRKTAVVLIRGVPNPPTGLSITDCYNLSTTLRWTPGDPSAASISRYIVEQEDASNPNVFVFHSNVTQPTATSVVLKLTPWADLRFRMRAGNSLGTSRPSLPTSSQCKTLQQVPDKYPDNFRGVPAKAEELHITWDPLTKLEQNAPGCRYLLQYRRNKETKWNPVIITDPTVGRFQVPNPGYYELWEFQIQAENGVGKGPLSPIVTSYSGQDVPKNKPTNLEKGDVTARSIELSWNPVTVDRGNVDGYRFYYWVDNQAGRRKRREIGANANSTDVRHTDNVRQKITVTGLKPFTNYKAAIVSFNSRGEGPASNQIDFRTLEAAPGPPDKVTVYAFGKYILVTWSPPLEENGIITGYELGTANYQIIENVTTIIRNIATGPDESRKLLNDKKYETNYTMEIVARTKIGSGTAVRKFATTVAKSAPAKPRAPNVEAVSTESIHVTFLFGLEKGGYPEQFKVYYREKIDGESWKETDWINHLDTQWVEIGNLNNALYEFKTVGRNEEGKSAYSDATDGRPQPGIYAEAQKAEPVYRSLWFIVLVGVTFFLLLVLMIMVLLRRRGGDKYPVGKREHATLDDPFGEEEGLGFPKNVEIPPSYQSNGKSPRKSYLSDSDRDSLDDYGEGPEFNEDGSFTREYNDNNNPLLPNQDYLSKFTTFV